MKNQRHFKVSIVLAAVSLALTTLAGPAASSAGRRLQAVPATGCGDFELNRYQERVYFKDTIEQITPMTDGTYVVQYAMKAAYYIIDPSRVPDSSQLLSYAQKALKRGKAIYTTASISSTDPHVIQYLADKQDPYCIPE